MPSMLTTNMLNNNPEWREVGNCVANNQTYPSFPPHKRGMHKAKQVQRQTTWWLMLESTEEASDPAQRRSMNQEAMLFCREACWDL